MILIEASVILISTFMLGFVLGVKFAKEQTE